MFRLESENKTGPPIEAGFLLLFAQSFRSPATADLQGCNECREMTGAFPVHAVMIAPLRNAHKITSPSSRMEFPV